MNLNPPPNLPSPLEDRWRRVEERLQALPGDVFEPYPRAAETVARVAVCSEFVLTTLLRQPEVLLSRLTDDRPLSAEQLRSRLRLAKCSETEALAALRRWRHVAVARIAWRTPVMIP